MNFEKSPLRSTRGWEKEFESKAEMKEMWQSNRDMDLEEFRAGNFGKYDPTQLITVERDNVAGREAIIEHSTADPGYGPPPGAEETAPAR